MLTQELIEYIRQAQNAGMTEVQIRKALAESGWASADIEQALAAMNKPFDTGRAERVAASVTPAVSTTTAREPVAQSNTSYQPATAPTQSIAPYQPSTSTQAHPTPSVVVEIPETHKRRTALMVGAGMAALLLLGGSAYAYVAYTSLPRVVMAGAAKEAAKVTTYETEESFKLEMREAGVSSSPKPISVSFTVTGTAQHDNRASTTPRIHANIAVEGDLAGVSMKGGGEFARVGNEFFVRVRDIPAVIAQDMGPMYAYFHDRWFSFNGDEFLDDLREAGIPEEALTEVETSLDQMIKPRDRLQRLASILPEDTSMFTEESGEIIDGEMARVYTTKGSRVFWIDTFKKLTDTTEPQELEAFDEFMKTLDESITDGTISGTVWVGKDSHQIRKIRLLITGTATEPQTNPAVLSGKENTAATFTLEYTQVFKKFNEPVEVIRPDPATPIMDFIFQSLGALQSTISAQSTNTF